MVVQGPRLPGGVGVVFQLPSMGGARIFTGTALTSLDTTPTRHSPNAVLILGPSLNQHWRNVQCFRESRPAQQTQNICITFIQRRPNVYDVGPTLYKVIQMLCVHWVTVQAWG